MSEEESFNSNEFQHPLLVQGYKTAYENDLIIHDTDDSDKQFHIQIFYRDNEEEENNSEILMEATVESDIYSIRRFEVNQESFDQFAKSQPFKKFKFADFVTKLERALDNVRTNRSSFSAVFSEEDDGYLLTIRQQLEFKRVDIFRLKFSLLDESNEEYLGQQAQYRYSFKLSQYDDEVRKLNELFDHIREKNPKLCDQLLKGSKFGQK